MIVVNKQAIPEESHSPEIRLKVESILDRGNFAGADTTLVKNQIFKALGGEKTSALALIANSGLSMYYELPKKLQEDKDIVLKVSGDNPEIYNHLSPKLRQDLEIQKNVLGSLIDKSASMLEVISIIESAPKNKKKLLSHLAELLENNTKFSSGNNLNMLVYKVFLEDAKTFDLMIQKGIFSSSTNAVRLGSRYIDILTKYQKDLEGSSPEEVQEKLLAHLAAMLQIPISNLSASSGELLKALVSQIKISKKQEEPDDEEEDTSDSDILESDDEDEIIVSIGPYSFTPIGSGESYNVSDNAGNSVHVEESERKSMNEKSLENYVNFSLKMKQLGLGFLIEKHKAKIQIATDVNFFEGEGMSPARTLQFLNKIGKRIGLPPSSYIDKDGNRETLRFHDISEAYFRLKEIASTGKIGGHKFIVANLRGASVIEEFMKEESEGIINRNSGGFSITSFQNTKTHQKAA